MPSEADITLSARISEPLAQPVQPRAVGQVVLSAKLAGHATALNRLRQSGSLRCLFPRSARSGLEAVLVNTAGGITGGDRFHVSAQVPTGCSVTLTTQACERAYRAQPGASGRMKTELTVAQGGHLNWLPQETILFERSSLRRSLKVALEDGASALIAEPLVFGRQAMREELTRIRFHDRFEIWRAGRPLFLDATRFEGDMAAHLNRSHIAAGARAMALLAYVSPHAESRLAPLRAMLPEMAGASLIGEDLLVLRILAQDSHALRQSLIPILRHLSHNQLPRCWMI